MTQPNFLELEWKLSRAIDIAAATPEKKSSKAYLELMQETVASFQRTTRETDAIYTSWRQARGDRMRTFRELRRCSDAARALADEHGLDAYPSERIVYTDEDQMEAFSQRVVAYLTEEKDSWSWISGKLSELNALLSKSAGEQKAAAKLFGQYQVRVKQRVAANDRAVAVLRDYLSDARVDVAAHELWPRIQLEAR